jgi:hypothetical protein
MIITARAKRSRISRPLLLPRCLLITALAAGCQPFGGAAPLSPELLELRSQWLTSSQPDGTPLGVIETRQQLTPAADQTDADSHANAASTGDAAAPSHNGPLGKFVADTQQPLRVTITGAIQAGRFEPWQPNQAAFVITDLDLARPASDHGGADHDPSTCPFCKRRQQDPLLSTAWVQCLDADGKVVALDARKLFGLQENQVVVVQGTAHIDAANRLVINAEQLFAVP